MIHYASSARDPPSVTSMRLAAFDAVSLRVLNEHDDSREPEKHEIKKKWSEIKLRVADSDQSRRNHIFEFYRKSQSVMNQTAPQTIHHITVKCDQ